MSLCIKFYELSGDFFVRKHSLLSITSQQSSDLNGNLLLLLHQNVVEEGLVCGEQDGKYVIV